MNSKIKTPALIFIESIFVFLFFLIQYSTLNTLKIGNALPALLVALTVICGFFFGESHGLGIGLISGILMDAVTVNSTCFFALLLMLIGFLAGVLATHYLNNNFGAAVTLGALLSALFFIAKWLFFYVFKSSNQSFKYLLEFALPSFVYTFAVYIIMYFLFKFIKKRLTVK